MGSKVLFGCLALLLLQQHANAQFGTCTPSGSITSIGGTISINHLASQGSCRYKVVSPADSYIQATCTVRLVDTTCNNQRFGFSRSGDINLADVQRYCVTGSYSFSSIGNELILAIIMSPNTASFTCTLRSVSAITAGCDCGWNVNTKIVGGSPTGINEFVSHAGLVLNSQKDAYCGAVIIRQFFAITAAHCVDFNSNPASAKLAVGSHYISGSPTDTKWSASYNIASFIKHGGYIASRGLHDIALVRTVNYIRYNPGVGPACIPYTFMNNDNYFNTRQLIVVGWGTTSFAGPTSDVLLKAPLTGISVAQCQAKMTDIDSTKICADGNRVYDSCAQDSGGGLYWRPSNNQYIIGIVNNGIGCAAGYPSVNSRVTSYVGWLEGQVGGGFCRKA